MEHYTGRGVDRTLTGNSRDDVHGPVCFRRTLIGCKTIREEERDGIFRISSGVISGFLSLMTPHIISSGWSCGCIVFRLFLEHIGGSFSSHINSKYFIHGNDPEGRRRLRLTIHFALVQGVRWSLRGFNEGVNSI